MWLWTSNTVGSAVDEVNHRLYAADTLHNRVMVWDTTTLSNGEAATWILGNGTATVNQSAIVEAAALAMTLRANTSTLVTRLPAE